MTVSPRSTPVPVGSVWRCTVEAGGELADAFIKPIPHYGIVREVLCSLIAQEVGLPVLRPGIVRIEDTRLREFGHLAFGTLAVETRELQGLYDDSVLRTQLARWRHLALAIAFDEWIANGDRTPRNLLFRGAGEFVLIDHGEALPDGLTAHGSATANLLARLAYADVTRDVEREAVRRVQEAATRFNDVDMTAVETASLAGSWDPDGMLRECRRLLADRLPYLPGQIVRRFGDRQQHLPMEPDRG